MCGRVQRRAMGSEVRTGLNRKIIIMPQVKGYCKTCCRVTWQEVPGYICEQCGKANPDPGEGESGTLGCSAIAFAVFFAVICVAFLAVNSLILLPSLLTHPWGLAGSVLLVGWLWKHDNLGAESALLRFGVSAFLILWMGLLIAAVTSDLFQLHLLSTGKELLFITLPGAVLGLVATMFKPRYLGKLWPVFVGICLAHTIGKATILGWIMNRF